MRESRMPPMVEKQSLEDALKDIPKWTPPPDEPKEPQSDNTGSTGSQRLDDALKDIPRYDPNAPEEPIPPEEPELPVIHLPQAKKNPAPWIVKLSVWTGILGSIAGMLSLFQPQYKPAVMAVVAILKAIFTALGA